MYEKALTLFKDDGGINLKSYALYGKAKVLAKLGEKKKAFAFYKESIITLERIRKQTAFSDMQRTFMETVYDHYEEVVLFMLENKYYEKGFKYAESMRARVFLDQMAEGMVPLEKGLKPQLKVERDNLV